MGIDISKIKNDVLRAAANSLDGSYNDNGELDGTEIELFKNMKENKTLDQYLQDDPEAWNQALGLYVDTATKASGNDTSAEKSKAVTNPITTKTSETTKEVTKEAEIVNKIDAKADAYDYTSEEKEILKKILEESGNDVNKFKELILNAYNEKQISIVAYAKIQQCGTIESLKYSLIEETLAETYDTIATNVNKQLKAEEEQFEKRYNNKDVSRHRFNVAMREYINENITDADTKDYLLDMVSTQKVDNKLNARDVQVEYYREQTAEEMDKNQAFNRLKKGNSTAYDKLFQPNMVDGVEKPALISKVTEEKDGQTIIKYDLTELQKRVQERIGLDNHLNQTLKELYNQSESKALNGLFKEVIGEDLKESELKMIAKGAGFDVSTDAWKRALWGMLLGGTIGAASAFATGMHEAAYYKDMPNVGATNYNILVNNLVKVGIISSEQALLSIEAISQIIIEDPGSLVRLSALKLDAALRSAYAGAILGALAGGLHGLLQRDIEVPVAGKDFIEMIHKPANEITLEDYADYVKNNETDPTSKILLMLASAYTMQQPDQKFNAEGFRALLVRASGGNSVLNNEELIGLVNELKNVKIEDGVNGNGDNGNGGNVGNDDNQGNKTCTVSVDTITEQDTTEKEVWEKKHERQPGDTWAGVVKAYYPELIAQCHGELYGANGAIRQLEIALANGDRTVLNRLLGDPDIPEIIYLPHYVGGIECKNGTVIAAEFELAENPVKPLASVGQAEVTEVVRHGQTVYLAKDGCDPSIYEPGKTKKEAVQNLIKRTGKTYTNADEYLKN